MLEILFRCLDWSTRVLPCRVAAPPLLGAAREPSSQLTEYHDADGGARTMWAAAEVNWCCRGLEGGGGLMYLGALRVGLLPMGGVCMQKNI